MAAEGQFRIRLWVERELWDERWVSTREEVEAVHVIHAAIVDSAAKVGARFMVELWDPTAPDEQSAMRFGNDFDMLREARGDG